METALRFAPLFGGLAAIVGMAALLVSVYQIRKAIMWNRLQAAFTYFPNPLTLETLENELDETIRFWSRMQPITTQEAWLLFLQSEIPAAELQSITSSARQMLVGLGRNPPQADADFLLEMRKTGRKLKAYLNEIERYCAAVNAGLIDNDTAEKIYSAKFRGHYSNLKELISFIQQKRNSKTIYVEFERLAKKWDASSPGIERKY